MCSVAAKEARAAKIDPQFLVGLAASHKDCFGALAELFDNSRDAGCTNIHVDAFHAESTSWRLKITDDGSGMPRSKLDSMLDLGKTEQYVRV